MKDKLVVVFDLDDTLYKELDYLKSAYVEIADMLSGAITDGVDNNKLYSEMLELYYSGENVFEKVLDIYGIDDYGLSDLISAYRNHRPKISLVENARQVLEYLHTKEITMGLITDGRSIQQRNKISALGIEKYFAHVIISEEIGSEKPGEKNYMMIQEAYDSVNTHFVYVGDNVRKDFIVPNQLGWISICLLDNGENVHSQDIEVPENYKPAHYVNNFGALLDLINGTEKITRNR